MHINCPQFFPSPLILWRSLEVITKDTIESSSLLQCILISYPFYITR